MQFDSLAAALAMEGHGPYVWACYGVTFLVLLVLQRIGVRRDRQILRRVAELQRRRAAREESV